MFSIEVDEEIDAWSKIPIPLQCQFLKQVDLEAEKCWEAFLRRNIMLEELAKEIEFRGVPKYEGWDRLKVAFVGSSYSLYSSRELELDYGTYTAGYAVFLGANIIKESYYSGVLSKEQTRELKKTQSILELLCTNLERTVALYCLKKENVDFMVINKGFYHFCPNVNTILDERIETGKFENGRELVTDTVDKSVELLESLKTCCIISNVRTSALDGWMIYRYGDDSRCVGLHDSSILARLMPRNSWFAYRWIFGKPGLYTYLSGLRETYLGHNKRENFKEVLKLHKNKVNSKVKKLCNSVSLARKLSRYYLRNTMRYSPLCLEAHAEVEVAPLIAYLMRVEWKFGLPYPIEFIRRNVFLPSKFAAGFVGMIKERVLDRSTH